jgi:uncharacterized integral membrane protein
MAESQTSGSRFTLGLWIRAAIAIVVLVVLLVFVFQNAGEVEIQFIFGSLQTRLVWALLLAAGLGFVLGWLLPRLRQRR